MRGRRYCASFSILFFLLSLVVGLTTGFTVIIGQYFGAKDLKKVRITIETALIFITICALLITVIGVLFSERLLLLLNTPKEIINDAKKYIDILFYGTIVLFGYNSIGAILRGLGDSLTPLIFLIISSILNIALDFIFVLYFKWGVAGVAWATVISQLVSFILGIIYLEISKHDVLRIRLNELRFDFNIFIRSIKIGLPTAIQNIFVSLGMLALLRIVNNFGTNAIAAYTAAGRLDSFSVMPAMNFSIAISTFVAQNLGANRQDRVRKGFISTLIMSNSLAVAISIIAILFRKQLITIFSKDFEVVQIGSQYLLIVGSFYIIFSIMFVLNGVMRGAGATLIPMFSTIIALWVVRIPLSAILSRYLGTDGIWWGIPLAWCVGTALNFIYYISGKWKNKVVIRYAD